MYVVMKEGKYFTGDVSPHELIDLLWTRRLADAKVWKQKRAWAQKAADTWGGMVVEIQDGEVIRQGKHKIFEINPTNFANNPRILDRIGGHSRSLSTWSKGSKGKK